MSESRRSSSKIPQILDKQASGHSDTQADRRERHKRDKEAAEIDTQDLFPEPDNSDGKPIRTASSDDRNSPVVGFEQEIQQTTEHKQTTKGRHIDHFSRDDLNLLLKDSTRTCVSIYLPTNPAGSIQPDMTLFKNLMRSCEKQLIELGMDAPDAANLLLPAYELLEDMPFWKDMSEGLAVFRSPELFRVYRVPMKVPEFAWANDHFQIQPLLPLLNMDGKFYVLTLSQHDIRLLKGNHERMETIQLEGVPRNMAEALNEEPERHYFDRNNAFGAGMAFHGHSQAKEDTKDRLNRFFHMVNKGLHKYLKDEKAPLILAGVEYLFPIYEEANTYAHLIPERIQGNAEILSPSELHDRAWPLVQPYFLKAQEQALTRYHEAKAAANLTSQRFEEIVSAAAVGRVDTLFTAMNAERHGIFDAEAYEVHIHEMPEVGDEELINFAAMQTLLHSGTVHALPAEYMPDGVEMAALFRY